jgi:predicted negative regulator of RcsB-dependent stress response
MGFFEELDKPKEENANKDFILYPEKENNNTSIFVFIIIIAAIVGFILFAQQRAKNVPESGIYSKDIEAVRLKDSMEAVRLFDSLTDKTLK